MQQPQSPLVSLAIVSVLVSICLITSGLAPLILLWRSSTSETVAVSPPHMTPAESNQLAREVFNSFDFNSASSFSLATVNPPDLGQFLQQVEEASADNESLIELMTVNKARFLDRAMESESQRLTALSRMILERQIPQSAGSCDYQYSLKVVRVEPVDPASETHVVHAIGYSDDGSESREWRYWLARYEDRWQVVDWQRIDIGLTAADFLADYQRLVLLDLDNEIFDYSAKSEMLDSYGSAMSTASAATIKTSWEQHLQDIDWVRLGYGFFENKYYDEALECGRRVKNTQKFPGAHRIQQLALFHSRDFEGSIEQGNAYLNLVGKSPEVLLWKGLALHAVGKSTEADQLFSEVVQLPSWKARAVVILTRDVGKLAYPIITTWLAHQESPTRAATELVGYYHFTDDGGEVLEILDSLVNDRSPGSAESHFISGALAAWNGDHEAAHQKHLLAVALASDEEAKQKYHGYSLSALERMGEVVAAYDGSSNRQEFVITSYWDRRNNDSELTEAEWTQLLLHHVQHFPNDPLAVDKLLEYLIANDDLERAEREIRQRMEYWLPQTDPTAAAKGADRENDESEGTDDEDSGESESLYESHVSLSSSLPIGFAQVMALTGRSEAAYQEVVKLSGSDTELAKDFFIELADVLVDLKQWESLETLIQHHQRLSPDDPHILLYRGDVAAHRQLWAKAVEWYEKALAAASEETRLESLARNRLGSALSQSDLWLDYYHNAPEKLAVIFQLEHGLGRDAPEKYEQLLQDYATTMPFEPTFAVWMLERAYLQGDVEKCLKWMEQIDQPLEQAESYFSIAERNRSAVHWARRRARIYVLAGKYGLARTEARRADESALIEVLIAAHQNRHADAAGMLLSKDTFSMYDLRKSENLNWAAFRPEYLELQKRDPFDLNSLDSQRQWIAYLREPVLPDLEQLKNTVSAVLGDEFSVSRPTMDPGSAKSTSIFVLTSRSPGNGKWYLQFAAQPTVDPLNRTGFTPEHVAADQAKGRVVISPALSRTDVSFWRTTVGFEQEAIGVLRLVEALIGEAATAWHDVDSGELVLPSSEWTFKTSLASKAVFRKYGVDGFRMPIQSTVGRKQQLQFRRALRAELLKPDLTNLRVRKTLQIGYLEEPIWFTVQSVEKRCGDLELRAAIASNIVFVPEISAGFPCRVKLSELDAFQINGHGVVTLGDAQ